MSAAGLAAFLAACAATAAMSPARADGLWDAVLEKMNVKAAPAAPGPDFVERTRPDPDGLGYLPTTAAHKVSPLAVKTPDQIQAEKDALDLAKKRQLDPSAGKPAQVGAAGGTPGTKAGGKHAKPVAASASASAAAPAASAKRRGAEPSAEPAAVAD